MIDLAFDAAIGVLTLDAPATRNALDMAGWVSLAGAVAQVAATPSVRALIVRGAGGGGFCAGSHLREIARLADHPDERAAFRQAMRAALEPLAALPIATIALIEGDCFGAGVALALACDIRIAGPQAVLAITPARLGITYPQEDVARLVALVGPGQAARLLYGAGRVDAAEAARIGLVEIVADDAALAARDLAAQIAGNAPTSLASLKAMVAHGQRGRDPAFDAAFDGAFGGAALAEGLAAFAARRAPRF